LKSLKGSAKAPSQAISRFQGDNFENKVQLINELKKIEEKKDFNIAELAPPWIKFHNSTPGILSIALIVYARSKLKTSFRS
jgi:aryl-alcohol dehydrogenase-like predicted oxidoreductase